MSLTVIIMLISLGLILILLEIFVLPGTTLPGISGIALIISGILCSYIWISATAGNYALIITAIITAVIFYYSLRSATWKKLMLHDTIDGKTNTFAENQIKKGDRGVTVSRLAPTGMAMFNDNIYEVNAFSDFINPNKEITIVKIEGSKIFVKQ